MTNIANLEEEDAMASHALKFLVRGLYTNVKQVIAYFFYRKCLFLPDNANVLETCFSSGACTKSLGLCCRE